MKLLAINYKPYAVDYALFDYKTRELITFGTGFYEEKGSTERIVELRRFFTRLLRTLEPTIVVTQMLDLRYTLKRDLEHIIQMRTILRLLCHDNNVMYNEFRTLGWEKRITELKKPSKKAKLKIVQEYSEKIDREETANAIILGEGVVWNRLQIGRD